MHKLQIKFQDSNEVKTEEHDTLESWKQSAGVAMLLGAKVRFYSESQKAWSNWSE